MMRTFFGKMREPVSGLTHFFAGVASVAGSVALLAVSGGDVGKRISLLVYGASLLVVFFASAAYHLVRAQPRGVQVLRKVDHAAIYVLIARYPESGRAHRAEKLWTQLHSDPRQPE